jgi:allantoinase
MPEQWLSGKVDACELSLVGRIVSSRGDQGHGEVRIRAGVIAAVSVGSVSDAPAEQRIDVGDAYVLPGLIDCHVHCLSHPGEGVAAATRSAAAGGVTTILEMPFDAEGPVWSVERFRQKQELVAREAHVDVGLYATVRPDGGGASVAELAEAGAVAFKLSMFDTDPARFPRTPDGRLFEELAAAAEVDRPVCVHAENDEIIRPLLTRLRATGDGRAELHAASRPPVSETAAVAEVLELARAARARIHLCHLSLPRSVDLVRQHADGGTRVTAETCPHYLLLSEDDLRRHGGRCKINPPLRRREDVDALWQRVRAGALDALSSDHAPWPLEQKTHDNVFDNHSGAPGVETLLPLVAGEALHRRDVPISSLVRLLSRRPAEVFGLAHRKGDLRPGLDADVVVFDPHRSWTLDERELHSNAGWSPYHGRHIRGAVTLTVARGEVVWDGRTVLSRPGRGRFVAPAVADGSVRAGRPATGLTGRAR